MSCTRYRYSVPGSTLVGTELSRKAKCCLPCLYIGRGFETFNQEDQCSIVRFTSLFEVILDRSSSRYRMVNITEIKKYVLISTSQSLPLDKADSYKLTLTLIIDRS